jgi:hypothetical protein
VPDIGKYPVLQTVDKLPRAERQAHIREQSRHPCNKDLYGNAKRQSQLSAEEAVVGDRGLIVFA